MYQSSGGQENTQAAPTGVRMTKITLEQVVRARKIAQLRWKQVIEQRRIAEAANRKYRDLVKRYSEQPKEGQSDTTDG